MNIEEYEKVIDKILPFGYTITLDSFDNCKDIPALLSFAKDNMHPELYQYELEAYEKVNSSTLLADIKANARYGRFEFLTEIVYTGNNN